MNTNDFTYLLNNPQDITESQVTELEKIISEFPYLQSARALRLKGLYNQNSFRYNLELKKTAAHTIDRSVLFDFITSDKFQYATKNSVGEITENIENNVPVNKLEESIKQTIKEAQNKEPEAIISLPIGKPLEFNKEEKHSFQEWLQLASISLIKRENKAEPEQDENKLKKLELIDKFIESNPKIIPSKNSLAAPVKVEKNEEDTSYLMTETLARVYLEQKKYQKAIQAYEILILKYPEKSVFFANCISDIKILQQNNN